MKREAVVCFGKTKAVQIDIVTHTKNDQVIFIDATSSAAEDEIFPRLDRKIRNLTNLGIDYDAFLYVTSNFQLNYPIKFIGKKACLLGLRQFNSLSEHIKKALEDMNVKV